MLKVFISIPMNGRNDKDILEEMEMMKRELKLRYPKKEFEFIDSFTKEEDVKNKGRIAMLGHSIMLMHDADVVFFAKDYRSARGCRIEEAVAIEYGIHREYYIIANKHEDTMFWR
jgi:hypothetical protein